MHDVAAAAGVSQAAVSYAFNRPGRLSAERQAYILKVAADLGYAGPNPSGRNLRLGTAGALGLLLTDSLRYAFDDPATAQLLKGISEVGEVAEIALTLLPCPLDSDRATQGAGVLARGAVDGFLAYAMPEGHPGIDTVLSRGLPVVVIDGPAPSGVPRVGIRDHQSAEQVADYVLSYGHRNIGILVDRLLPDGQCGFADDDRITHARDRVMSERLAGYRAALEHAGVPWSSVPVVEAGGFDTPASEFAAETLLRHSHVSAILAATDVLALATRTVARRRGLIVPRELSIVGFDDIPAAASSGLSTVRQPLVDKGRRATQLLLDIIGGGPRADIVLQSELVERDTVAVVSATVPPASAGP